MGHDIFAQNDAGEMIAYLRYTMSDRNSYEIYKLLDVMNYHGGVSGIGISSDFSRPQIENALKNYDEARIRYAGNKKFEESQRKEIRKFLTHCLETVKKEDTVQIIFA